MNFADKYKIIKEIGWVKDDWNFGKVCYYYCMTKTLIDENTLII